MFPGELKKSLRFYYITDESTPARPPLEQVTTVLKAGATFIQYRHKSITPRLYEEVVSIRNLCKTNGIPFVINDDIILAKAVRADGVHLGQTDEAPATARQILGPEAIIGISVSTQNELENTDFSSCDYIGTGPVFPTDTKPDAKGVIGLSGLKAVVEKVSMPVVAIGGIDGRNAGSCFTAGASGVAVISAVSRAQDPFGSASSLAAACGCPERNLLESPWHDEFALIDKLLESERKNQTQNKAIKIPPGDDAALFGPLKNPVITTDSQREGVHFYFSWLKPEEIGNKAVEITLSDLAASYAEPVSLFINLTLPDCISEKTVESLYAGIFSALNRHKCSMGGGNISKGERLALDLFAMGNGMDTLFPARSGALPEDGLYCTGPLGLARAGLLSLQKKDAKFPRLIDKFKSPLARFDASKALAQNAVRCVIDISDGLAGDALHITKASGISIEFDMHPSDFDPDLVDFCKKYSLDPKEVILSGGEDYELLFACRPSVFQKIKKALPSAIRVGQCLPFNGTPLRNLPPGVSSFQHGK